MRPGVLQQLVRRPAWVAGVVVVAAFTIWWQYPALAGHGSGTDVVIVADGFLHDHQRPVGFRIREDGLSLAWASAPSNWCEASTTVATAVAEFRPRIVVLSFSDLGPCGASGLAEAVRAAGDREVVVVTQPGSESDRGDVGGARVVRPDGLIGATLEATDLPCQWWETCPTDGKVQVRTSGGALTDEGADRVARLLIAAL